MNIRKLTRAEVTFNVTIEPEEIDPRGNAIASGDDTFDRECENEIITRLNIGDTGTWCCVKVVATWGDIESNPQYLGGCSFSESDCHADIERCADDHGMLDEALDSLNAKVQALASYFGELIES